LAYCVSDRVLEFDKQFIADMMQVPVTNRERLAVVCRALRKAIDNELTPRQREVLLMRWFENRSGAEIAAILHLNPSTVCRDLKRAQARLRKSLQFYMDFLNCNLDEDA
jgi:RNA polymerase sigma-70 factor (ECF subfamily)